MTHGDWIAAWTFMLVAAFAVVAWAYMEGSYVGLLAVAVIPVCVLYLGENVARFSERKR